MNQGAMLMNVGDSIKEIYIVEQGIVEVVGHIAGQEIVLERLFRGSVINYKNVFLNTHAMLGYRFASESVIKSLSLETLHGIGAREKTLQKAVQKFQLKVSQIPAVPLDYILVLPDKVYKILIERTREKMLFGK